MKELPTLMSSNKPSDALLSFIIITYYDLWTWNKQVPQLMLYAHKEMSGLMTLHTHLSPHTQPHRENKGGKSGPPPKAIGDMSFF